MSAMYLKDAFEVDLLDFALQAGRQARIHRGAAGQHYKKKLISGLTLVLMGG